jgi:hypothetical protein
VKQTYEVSEGELNVVFPPGGVIGSDKVGNAAQPAVRRRPVRVRGRTHPLWGSEDQESKDCGHSTKGGGAADERAELAGPMQSVSVDEANKMAGGGDRREQLTPDPGALTLITFSHGNNKTAGSSGETGTPATQKKR